ncbi:hypothetical protein O9992_22195 [Vibrio lentus]|nr:hypothetical protein [Vibrio lentus]
MNSMLNVHNPRQCHTTKNWSRYLSLYQLGYGARGIGFRDSSQDTLGVITSLRRKRRVSSLSVCCLFRTINGSCDAPVLPINDGRNAGDSREEEDRLDWLR